MDESENKTNIRHIANAIDNAKRSDEPFFHLRLTDIFPPDTYAQLLETMPASEDYRVMSGRTKSTRTNDGYGTRVKLDLFPEYVRHLPEQKRKAWKLVGKALCSKE